MKRPDNAKLRARAPDLAAAATATALIVWGAVSYGPSPKGPAEPAVAQPAAPTAERAVEAEVAAPAPEAEASTSFRGALAGGPRSGHDEAGVKELVDRIEERYRRRGYVRGRHGARAVSNVAAGRRGPSDERLYWRAALPQGELILATGVDGDPFLDDPSARPDLFVTTVAPGVGGGANWSTLRYGFAREFAAALEAGADFPGGDPPDVPRADGTRRLLSLPQAASGGEGFLAVYESDSPAHELAAWYVGEMSRRWSYDVLATEQARELAEGVYCFTRPGRFCMLWVSPAEGGRTTLVVSLRQR
jgi:hypothetical protein